MIRIQSTFATGLVATLFALLIWAGSASAAFNHAEIEKTFLAGSACTDGPSAGATDVDVSESSQLVYVVCKGGSGAGKPVIERYDYEGNPVNFPVTAPYVVGNKIVEDPGVEDGRIGIHIAVANSAVNNGYIFVASGRATNVSIFKPSGEFAGAIRQPYATAGFIADDIEDVDVASDGSVYVAASLPGRRISKYDSSFHELSRLYSRSAGVPSFVGAQAIRVDSTGAIWGKFPVTFNSKISKYEADGFSDNLALDSFASDSILERFEGSVSPFYSDPLIEGNIGGIDVAPTDDDFYVNFEGKTHVFNAGDAEENVHEVVPPFGSSAAALAVTGDQRVFAVEGAEVTRYGPGEILPDVRTRRPDVDAIGHEGATLTGRIEPDGGAPVTECALEYGTTTAYGSEVSCSPDPAASPPSSNFATDTDTGAEVGGLTTGTPYHYRFRAANAHGTNYGIDRTVTPVYVLKVKTLAAEEIDDRGAKLKGSLDPDGLETTYHFDYGVDTGYGLSTPEQPAGEGTGVIALSQQLSGLPSGRVWHYRLVAENINGTTYGPDLTFRTTARPDVAGARTAEVTLTTALLSGRIDPGGYETTYRFEYGTTPEYGSSIPIPDESIGSGEGAVEVAQRIEGLRPGTTYHFRIVATNKWGTASSPDTTFDYSPPLCPNEYVRQQTNSSYLPDCRAYEMVSPGRAGGVLFFPSQEAWDSEWVQDNVNFLWALNSGRAISPPRFSYFGGLGSIAGLDAPNVMAEGILDTYLATRTTTGWVSTVPGLHGKEFTNTGRRECSESFSVCIDHSEGGFEASVEKRENAPYFSDSEGNQLKRLPTNLAEVPGGEYFNGNQRLAADGGYFVFSSSNVAFDPEGLTAGLGSAYGNDIASGEVEVISKLPGGGGDILQDGSAAGKIDFPVLSPDGSHVLMSTPAEGGGSHLYMRVDEAVTYDVSRGAGVQFVAASRDGSKVYFISSAQLDDDDHDTSADLYLWAEQGDALTVVSQGDGAGDSDGCSSSWSSGCGVKALESDRAHPKGRPTIPGLDDLIADESGDIYFLSPELLDPDNPGIPNQPNLYLYREGAPRLVATLDPGTKVNRIQISPDGSRMAFVTAARLTSYDNKGYQQMYAYDADTGAIRCASCNPSGLAPSANVEASQGGPFMSDDGRAFFATKDSLVPRDTDGILTDVYEYVGGRPQLISSGVSARDYTGGSKVLSTVLYPEYTGLESVSANGVDVFFSTFDTLVPQDQNGEFVKFYDARTGGGFQPAPDLAPCAAADECHGADGSAPPPAPIASGAPLVGGNATPQANAKKKSRAKKKKSRAKKHRQQLKAGRGGSRRG